MKINLDSLQEYNTDNYIFIKIPVLLRLDTVLHSCPA